MEPWRAPRHAATGTPFRRGKGAIGVRIALVGQTLLDDRVLLVKNQILEEYFWTSICNPSTHDDLHKKRSRLQSPFDSIFVTQAKM